MYALPISLKSDTKLLTVFQVIACSFLLALSAQIAIPLPFSPVPVTMQTLAVLFIGIKLGPVKAAMAVMTYLAEIAMGFPFLPGGIANPMVLVGFKSGYYIGFVLQAYLIGSIARLKMDKSTLFLGALLTCSIQMFLGVSWLAGFVGWKSAMVMGFIPFIPGEIIKSYAVSTLSEIKK